MVSRVTGIWHSLHLNHNHNHCIHRIHALPFFASSAFSPHLTSPHLRYKEVAAVIARMDAVLAQDKLAFSKMKDAAKLRTAFEVGGSCTVGWIGTGWVKPKSKTRNAISVYLPHHITTPYPSTPMHILSFLNSQNWHKNCVYTVYCTHARVRVPGYVSQWFHKATHRNCWIMYVCCYCVVQ